MDRRQWTDPAPGAALGTSRTHVLQQLRAAGTPQGVHDIAVRAGLHPNTVRFHLDRLVADGLARRDAEQRERPGRPRVVYLPVAGSPATGRRSYRLLAEMLAGVLADAVPDPRAAATRAGRAWGRYLTERPAPFQRVDADQAVRALAAILTDIGFIADPAPADDRQPVRLGQCPFKEVAEHHQDVVCGLHLGLMQGALAEMRAPLTAERLDPLVEPDLCHAHFRRVAPPDARPHTQAV